MKYRVLVREVHVQHTIVEADSEEEAIKKVAEGEETVDVRELEYSHTLDKETWTAEKEPEEETSTEESVTSVTPSPRT